jgi:hypothetical protein
MHDPNLNKKGVYNLEYLSIFAVYNSNHENQYSFQAYPKSTSFWSLEYGTRRSLTAERCREKIIANSQALLLESCLPFTGICPTYPGS